MKRSLNQEIDMCRQFTLSIPSFIQNYFSRAYCVSSSILGTVDITANKKIWATMEDTKDKEAHPQIKDKTKQNIISRDAKCYEEKAIRLRA